MSDPSSAPRSFSFARVLLLALPLAVVLWGAFKLYGGSVEQQKAEAEAKGRRSTLVGLMGESGDASQLAAGYADADGDMLADPPAASDAKDPEELKFSYVSSGANEGAEQEWQELLAALKEKTGKNVTLVTYADTGEQLRALASGDLHVTAFSTGEAPVAVTTAGFIPVACFANASGDYRITMRIIVPADSPIEKLPDLKGRHVKFVRPRSHTGCTAALVLLMDKHNLQPERDYHWGFSFDHEKSIAGVAAKKVEAAAVASDILDRMIAAGDVQKDAIKVIYESEPFPPSVVGFAHNLTPELRTAITATLLEFDLKGTGLEKRYGASGAVKFASVNYKEDWKAVREIRSAGSELLSRIGSP
ncbi:MAG TPA: phosphate/phosphite/phosphonate ABC transporter substrate-binding protein [Lacipirellulaceae bacterium]|nr:phosphate/phosphite/phosphonate ABC transporter substrate-binding protein [Lacipirellulaceae bacterium]